MAHILVVDDDAQIRATIVAFIEKLGYDVAQAADGREALRYIGDHSVDLILLDIIMPEQDGIGTILEIMKMPVQPAIITMSGGSRNFDTDFIQKIATKLPIKEFLLKPLSLDDLRSAIEKALPADAD